MRIQFFLVINAICLFASSLLGQVKETNLQEEIHFSYTHPIAFSPKHYICKKLESSIVIDGQLSDSAWDRIEWTKDFTDIEGTLKPTPYLKTRAKMAWDDQYFYVAAELEEPHIWATLTQRDAIMFQDDDFEIFIDPDADGHNYFEFEMNAFNAIWDLYMLYPYNMDKRRNYIMNWDMKGIKTAVHVDGTINDPSDKDAQWSLEVAIPWTTFKDFKTRNHIPEIGEQWRINFSRVDWYMDIVDGKYVKRKDEKGKKLRENNWVWSPTGYVNMHKPETWGFVQFEDSPDAIFKESEEEKIRWAIWQLYYQVKACWRKEAKHCKIDQFDIPKVSLDNFLFSPELSIDEYGFDIKSKIDDQHYLVINEIGLIKKKLNR